MSSIAYLTDEDMLSFHRSQGHRQIVFWRLNTKRFERFEQGDLLFFIDKRYLHPQTGEKGLIGFGKLKKIRSLSVQRTWQDYGKLTGFHSYERFKNKVLAMNEELLPEWIQSLYLEEVLFFKAPIFLGEVGEKLNRNLESFTYLEDYDVLKLLDQAKKQGVDQWFSMLQEKTLDNCFEVIKREMHIRKILREINMSWTQEQERMMTHRSGEIVASFRYHLKPQLSIEIPVSSFRNQYYQILGVIYEFQKKYPEDVEFVLLTKKKSQEYEEKLSLFDEIKLEYI